MTVPRLAATLVAATLACLAPAATAQPMTCDAPPFDGAPEVAALIDAVAPVLAEFPTLADTLTTDVRQVCIADKLLGARGYFEAATGRIVVAPDMSPGLQQAVLIHELRHLQQQQGGPCPAPGLSMDANARAVFAMEADASVASLIVAWSMREAGAPAMWQALGDWPMQSDIAAAFGAEMQARGDIATAASAAFTQWYAREDRRDAYYIAACSDYLDDYDRTHLLPSYGALDPDFFTRLCLLPDGEGYECRDGG